MGVSKMGFSLIWKSRLLLFILLIVVLMQIAIAIADYLFNAFLEQAITNVDLRTGYAGKISIILHICTTCFQVFGSYLFIHLLGIKSCLLSIPLFLLANALLLLFRPCFSLASYAYVSIKTRYLFSIMSRKNSFVWIKCSRDEFHLTHRTVNLFFIVHNSLIDTFIFISVTTIQLKRLNS